MSSQSGSPKEVIPSFDCPAAPLEYRTCSIIYAASASPYSAQGPDVRCHRHASATCASGLDCPTAEIGDVTYLCKSCAETCPICGQTYCAGCIDNHLEDHKRAGEYTGSLIPTLIDIAERVRAQRCTN